MLSRSVSSHPVSSHSAPSAASSAHAIHHSDSLPPRTGDREMHAPQESMLEVLRRETKAAHDALETAHKVNSFIQRKPEGSLAEQKAFLKEYKRVYGYYLYAALLYEQHMEKLIDATDVGRSALRRLGMTPENPLASVRISNDLKDLGLSPKSLPGVKIPPLPVLASEAACAGAHYVRSGSRMGGVVIGSVVRDNLKFDDTHGARFLNMHGRGTAAYFGSFCRGAETFGIAPTEREQAARAAIDCFKWVAELNKQIDELAFAPQTMWGKIKRLIIVDDAYPGKRR